MTAFTVSNQSTATVAAERAAVWSALTDPDLLPRLTPYLSSVEPVDGDGETRWVWTMTKIPVLGSVVSPRFTELMTFQDRQRIAFRHDPAHDDERAGVEGAYDLADAEEGGTSLRIELQITVELPFPRVAGGAVRTAMRAVVAHMGQRFATNLVRHLEARPR